MQSINKEATGLLPCCLSTAWDRTRSVNVPTGQNLNPQLSKRSGPSMCEAVLGLQLGGVKQLQCCERLDLPTSFLQQNDESNHCRLSQINHPSVVPIIKTLTVLVAHRHWHETEAKNIFGFLLPVILFQEMHGNIYSFPCWVSYCFTTPVSHGYLTFNVAHDFFQGSLYI